MRNRYLILSILILILSLPAELMAGDLNSNNELIIVTPVQAQSGILPDRYVLSSNVVVKSSTEADVLNILGKLDRKVRERGIKYKGGVYSVYKNCWWQKDREICEGYRGNVSYRFEMSTPSEQNKILQVFAGYKETSNANIDINISGTRWIVSEETLKRVMEELRFRIIRNSMDFADKVSDMLKRTCTVKEINFQPRPTPSYPPYRTMVKEKTLEAPEPTRDEQTVIISAEIKVLCN